MNANDLVRPYCIVPKALLEVNNLAQANFELHVRHSHSSIFEVLDRNPSIFAPYHNNAHMYGVAAICHFIYMREQEGRDVTANAIMLSLLCNSAFRHDFAHTAGKAKDDVNIQLALDEVNRDYDDYAEICKIESGLISVTQYPFVREPDTHLERILRDADILYATLTLDPAIIMRGLREELQVSMQRHISYKEMHLMQVKFASEAKLYTETGRMLFERYSQTYLDMLAHFADSNLILSAKAFEEVERLIEEPADNPALADLLSRKKPW